MAIAPLPIIIPAQNTSLGPEKSSFFQALSTPAKISKGTIEIINDVPILKSGDKVGASEATLLILPIYCQWFQELVGYCCCNRSGVQADATIKEFIKDASKFAAAAASIYVRAIRMKMS